MPRPKWTVEQCREMGRRSAALRAERKLHPPLLPEMAKPIQVQLDSPTLVLTHDPQTARTLARVRMQIDLCLTRITEELAKRRADGQRVDRLANALWRLSELERYLAGRPAPGNFRPVAPRQSRAGQSPLAPLGPTIPEQGPQ